MLRSSYRTALLLLCCFGLAAAQAHADHWFAIPDLTAAEVDRLAERFELRGTHGRVTLAIVDAAAEDELLHLHPRALRAAEHRPDEDVFAVYLAPGERLKPSAAARLLLERDDLALVGLPSGSAPAVVSALRERRSGLFHDGIARIPDRRQRPQAGAPPTAAPLEPDARVQAWLDSVSEANLRADVRSLSTLFDTRQSDTPGGSDAQQWLIDRFEALGLATSTHSFDGGADNVIAEIPGAIEPEAVVIVGAHYDSVAFGGGPAPGADDNASGVAALLEIARIFAAERAAFRYTLRLVAFASEEFGLLGSSAYSKRMLDENVDVVAMLNTDMNAYRRPLDRLDLDMVTSSATDWLTDDLIAIANLYLPDLPVVKGPLFAGASDHAAFFNDGFPAAFYFEDIDRFSPYIHTVRDTIGRSANDFELARAIVQAILAGAAVLAEPAALSHSGSCPGEVTLEIRDLTPGASIFVVGSPNEGDFSLRGRWCRGLWLELDRPSLLGATFADADGYAELKRVLPTARCGLFVQAIDRSACAATHVIQLR